MLIRSQDKKTLTGFEVVTIDKKFIDLNRTKLIGWQIIIIPNGGYPIPVGLYSTEDIVRIVVRS